MKISECIAAENVEVDLNAPSKERLLKILSEKAGRLTGVSEHDISSALQNREKLGSTGIGSGIAIPHAPVAGLKHPFGLIVRLGKPMNFDSIDGEPVDIVCLLIFPAEGGSTHLTVLSSIARVLRASDTVRRLRSARSKEELYAVITQADA